MELRDQTALDAAYRPWVGYNEVQQGALLVELSATLRRRLMHAELEVETARAYRGFAFAARNTGNALILRHGVPFVPDPPFQWSRMPLKEIDSRVGEITAWASATVVSDQQPLPIRHAALDLSQAGQELERQLERTRVR